MALLGGNKYKKGPSYITTVRLEPFGTNSPGNVPFILSGDYPIVLMETLPNFDNFSYG